MERLNGDTPDAHCPRCQYDLRGQASGTPPRCPECGCDLIHERDLAHEARFFRGLWWWSAIVVMLGTALTTGAALLWPDDRVLVIPIGMIATLTALLLLAYLRAPE